MVRFGGILSNGETAKRPEAYDAAIWRAGKGLVAD